jgi:hypothetical protein
MLHTVTSETKRRDAGRPSSAAADMANRPTGPLPSPLAGAQSAYGNQAMLRYLSATGSLRQSPSGVLQRKCACGGAGGDCAECKKKEPELQRKATTTGSRATMVPPIVHDVLRSPGQPLDRGTRAAMESSFGQDFSGVRVHTDARAAKSAGAVNALAYTMGRNVVFGPRLYNPGSTNGCQLLAHELAHVVQQRGRLDVPATLTVGPDHDPSEVEAEHIANAFPRLNSVARVTNFGPSAMIRRAPIYAGRILDEGSCGDLVAHSKWICCDPDHGAERKGKTTDIDGHECPSQKFTPTFTCDNNCEKALAHGCDDSDNWMALPKTRFTTNKCRQDLVICAGGQFTHAYVRDRSEREAWEVSRAIPAALGIPPDFSAVVYGDESDKNFKNDKRCFKAAPKDAGTSTASPDGGTTAKAKE